MSYGVKNMSEFECLMCKWKGTGNFSEKQVNGNTITYFDCPKCGSNIYSKTEESYEEI